MLRLTRRRAGQLVPDLAKAAVVGLWAGYVDSTPDGVPVMSAIAGTPGMILPAGFSGHGFGIGSGAGHMVADIATGAEPIVDARPYDLVRFDRGERSRWRGFEWRRQVCADCSAFSFQ